MCHLQLETVIWQLAIAKNVLPSLHNTTSPVPSVLQNFRQFCIVDVLSKISNLLGIALFSRSFQQPKIV